MSAVDLLRFGGLPQHYSCAQERLPAQEGLNSSRVHCSRTSSNECAILDEMLAFSKKQNESEIKEQKPNKKHYTREIAWNLIGGGPSHDLGLFS